MKLDNYQLGLKRLKVAISNPPKRGTAATNYPTEGETPTNYKRGGGGGEEMGARFQEAIFHSISSKEGSFTPHQQ